MPLDCVGNRKRLLGSSSLRASFNTVPKDSNSWIYVKRLWDRILPLWSIAAYKNKKREETLLYKDSKGSHNDIHQAPKLFITIRVANLFLCENDKFKQTLGTPWGLENT